MLRDSTMTNYSIKAANYYQRSSYHIRRQRNTALERYTLRRGNASYGYVLQYEQSSKLK